MDSHVDYPPNAGIRTKVFGKASVYSTPASSAPTTIRSRASPLFTAIVLLQFLSAVNRMLPREFEHLLQYHRERRDVVGTPAEEQSVDVGIQRCH